MLCRCLGRYVDTEGSHHRGLLIHRYATGTGVSCTPPILVRMIHDGKDSSNIRLAAEVVEAAAAVGRDSSVHMLAAGSEIQVMCGWVSGARQRFCGHRACVLGSQTRNYRPVCGGSCPRFMEKTQTLLPCFHLTRLLQSEDRTRKYVYLSTSKSGYLSVLY